jgi:hypothetical protein
MAKLQLIGQTLTDAPDDAVMAQLKAKYPIVHVCRQGEERIERNYQDGELVVYLDKNSVIRHFLVRGYVA